MYMAYIVMAKRYMKIQYTQLQNGTTWRKFLNAYPESPYKQEVGAVFYGLTEVGEIDGEIKAGGYDDCVDWFD